MFTVDVKQQYNNSLTTKNQMTKFSSANFQKMLHLNYIVLRIQKLEGNSVDLDEVAQYEPPHQDLRCLQIQLFLSLVLKELIKRPKGKNHPNCVCQYLGNGTFKLLQNNGFKWLIIYRHSGAPVAQ